MKKKTKKNHKPKSETNGKRGFLHRDMTFQEKVIGFILFICLCVFSYLVLPISRVNKIEVLGNRDVTVQEVIASSGVHPNQLILGQLLVQSQIQEAIQASNLRVKSVSISVKDLTTLQITIQEHATIAYIEQGNQYFSALSSGVLLQEVEQRYLGAVPVVNWGGDMAGLEVMLKELALIDSTLLQNIAQITYKPEDKLVMVLYMTDGNQVKVNYTHFAEKLAYYNSMKASLNGKKGIIDLTVGAYFAPYQ